MLSIGLIPHFFILFSVSFYFKVSLTFSVRFLLSSVFVFRSSVKFIYTGLLFLSFFSSGFSSFLLPILIERLVSGYLFTLPSVNLLLIKIDIFLKAFLGSPSYVFGGLYLAFSDYGVIRYLPVGLYLLFLDYSFSMLNITGLYLRR